jgi:hypothetical protein
MSKLLKSEWLPVKIYGYIVLLDTHQQNLGHQYQ